MTTTLHGNQLPGRVAGAPRRRPVEFRYFGPTPNREWPVQRKEGDRAHYLEPLQQEGSKRNVPLSRAAASLGYGKNHVARRRYTSPYTSKQTSKQASKVESSPQFSPASLGYGSKHPQFYRYLRETHKNRGIPEPSKGKPKIQRPKSACPTRRTGDIKQLSRSHSSSAAVTRPSSASATRPKSANFQSPVRKLWSTSAITYAQDLVKETPKFLEAQSKYRAASLGYGNTHTFYNSYLKTADKPKKAPAHMKTSKRIPQPRPCWR